MKCGVCGLVFQNPRETTSYEENYWHEPIDPDGKKRILVNEREHKIKNLYRDELKYINGKTIGGRILDVGCGFGFFLSALNGKWIKYGLESSNYCVEYIEKMYSDINIVRSYIEDNKFDKSFFDVIYNFSFIEHICNPKKLFLEFSRILKTGGELIITTPNIESFIAKRFKGNYRLLGKPHIIIWSPRTIKNILEKHGFKIQKILYPFLRTNFFTLKNILRIFNTEKISPPFYGNIMSVYAKKIRDV